MARILLIDDEDKLRSLLARIVALEGFEVLEASDGKSGMKQLERHEVDVALCDVKLPDVNGVTLTSQIKTAFPQVEVILLTAYGNIPDGVQAIKNGAFDYITKGDDNNKIIPLLHRALEKVQLARRVKQLEKQLGERFGFDQIIGSSPELKAAIALARKVAGSDTTVLLTGETGTGKEVFAQAIHQASLRRNAPFIAINCAAFSRDLLESEMFGHKAGAFTGALKDKKGLLEEAGEGTLFLDEIGEMPLEMQSKLLRVLENGEYYRLGDPKVMHSKARIICATNRNLQTEIEAGHFRSDLYYRVSVFKIELPPLRERARDIEALACSFAEMFSAKNGNKLLQIEPAYIQALQRYGWPGNIRELKNIVERSLILMENGVLNVQTLPPEFHETMRVSGKILSAFDLASAEKLHILKVLNHTKGNKTEAARLLNIALTTLYRKIEEFGIR